MGRHRLQRVQRHYPQSPATELRKTFEEMEVTLDVASAICPHCGGANLFLGFSEMLTYTCKKCGKAHQAF
ncbi:MAG TPA: hypothetical protein VH640_31670 [Bryobacteraceae bacterium]|jgi:uncharacterized protein (DUF983 family)